MPAPLRSVCRETTFTCTADVLYRGYLRAVSECLAKYPARRTHIGGGHLLSVSRQVQGDSS